MIVVSYYTGVGRYTALAQRLATSCERFGLQHHIEQHEDRGGWEASLAIKPRVILSALLRHRGAVLWLDADCELLAPFPQAPVGVDFGIHNWCADAENPNGMEPSPPPLVASGGVMYADYTAPVLELVVRWLDAMERNPARVDDQCLSAIYTATRPPVTPWWFGRQLNWMTGLWGKPPSDCIVRHDYTAGQHRAG